MDGSLLTQLDLGLVVSCCALGLLCNPWLDSLINPNVVAWFDLFVVSLAMCESASVPLFLMGIMPSLGVAMLLRD